MNVECGIVETNTTSPGQKGRPKGGDRSGMSKATSVTPDGRQRLTEQISLQSERISLCRGRSPSVLPSRRWSSILSPEVRTSGRVSSRVVVSRPPSSPSSPYCPPSHLPPPRSAYTSALVRQSQRLRDRSLSPSLTTRMMTEQ